MRRREEEDEEESGEEKLLKITLGMKEQRAIYYLHVTHQHEEGNKDTFPLRNAEHRWL